MKDFFKKMLTDIKDSPSSMRFNIFLLTLGGLGILLSISIYIIVIGVLEHMKQVDFIGLSAIITSLGFFYAAIFYQKVQQKKYEEKK